ncbi:MAG: hypothetical protein M3Q48_18175, partial [Actinomycetota bacterium]|nr:hypothetical protein [Actinomycetota bacterium]
LALRPGQRVDVLATFDTGEGAGEGDGEGDGGPPTFPVAQGALVLDVGEEWVTVGVEAGEAPRVAFAVARGTVALALTSPA